MLSAVCWKKVYTGSHQLESPSHSRKVMLSEWSRLRFHGRSLPAGAGGKRIGSSPTNLRSPTSRGSCDRDVFGWTTWNRVYLGVTESKSIARAGAAEPSASNRVRATSCTPSSQTRANPGQLQQLGLPTLFTTRLRIEYRSWAVCTAFKVVCDDNKTARNSTLRFVSWYTSRERRSCAMDIILISLKALMKSI